MPSHELYVSTLTGSSVVNVILASEHCFLAFRMAFLLFLLNNFRYSFSVAAGRRRICGPYRSPRVLRSLSAKQDLGLNRGPVLVVCYQQQGFGSVCEASRSRLPRLGRLAVSPEHRQVSFSAFMSGRNI